MTASIFIFTVISGMMFSLTSAACNPGNGPAGGLECLALGAYRNTPQWLSCVSSEYFGFRSRGKRECVLETATYCYYQCMLEVHDKEEGKVDAPCACNPQDPAPSTSLPGHCFSPNGSDCSWFNGCLNAELKCAGGSENDDQYGIRYGENFCRMYDKSHNTFSATARDWVSAVRRCLEVDLVPLIRPFRSTTCQDIRTQAIDSYSKCYLKPYKDITSICDLSAQDFWKVFWTIKKTYQADFVEEIYGLLVILLSQCAKPKALTVESYMTKLVISVWLPHCALYDHCIIKRSVDADAIAHTEKVDNTFDALTSKHHLHRTPRASTIVKRSVDDDEDDAITHAENLQSMIDNVVHSLTSGRLLHRSPRAADTLKSSVVDDDTLTSKRLLHRRSRAKREVQWQGESAEELYYHRGAVDMTKHLATAADWETQGVTWFTYGSYSSADNVLQVHVLLADKLLGGNRSLNLTQVALNTGAVYQRFLLDFKVDGIDVPTGFLLGCRDQACSDVYMNVTGPGSNAAVTRNIGCMMIVALATLAVKISSQHP